MPEPGTHQLATNRLTHSGKPNCVAITQALTSAALRTVRVRSPILRPLSPAHATSTTLGSEYTTKPYLQQQQGRRRWAATVTNLSIDSTT